MDTPEQLRDWLARLQPESETVELPPLSLAAFSDDLLGPDGRRRAIRACLTPAGGGYRIDLRDSAPASTDDPVRITEQQARTAVTLAVAHALECTPSQGLAEQLTLECEPSSMIGAGPSLDLASTAFVMARLFDTVLGALAQAWPARVGAGSCSLGALVQLDDQIEVVPGGEGGQPDRPGIDDWSSPVIATRRFGQEQPRPEWLEVTSQAREGSGGFGARSGGDGIVRRYRVTRSVQARVCLDRTTNPPHGIDRAGPPQGSLARLETRDGSRAVALWTPFELEPGQALVVETCGGAGHGFPGYGDIEWDPSEWFGSKKTS